MKKAEWITEYDMHMDKCYKCPGCDECYAPIFENEDGQYQCVSCGELFEVSEPKMIKYFEDRKGTKVEMEDCFLGCGEKKCVEVHYRKNPVTLKWQCMGGVCTKCKMRFIV